MPIPPTRMRCSTWALFLQRLERTPRRRRGGGDISRLDGSLAVGRPRQARAEIVRDAGGGPPTVNVRLETPPTLNPPPEAGRPKARRQAAQDYEKKRDFAADAGAKTAAPKASAAEKRPGTASWCKSTRRAALHYDLRLELDGVLKSWAVTRGPSLSVGEKRLAVQTEDHPLAYLDFEGNIPKGEYGGGAMIVWDRGHWEPEGDPQRGLAKGHLEFALDGARLKGRWHLVRMKPKRGESDRAVAAHQGGGRVRARGGRARDHRRWRLRRS